MPFEPARSERPFLRGAYSPQFPPQRQPSLGEISFFRSTDFGNLRSRLRGKNVDRSREEKKVAF